ncbi:58 kDa phosphoprotein (Heat shock-related protein) (HRP) [Durusdinium trenchii]|uniref:58 kDa phosphoprotein (Heat shock-related protein) (HRP) n=1 Tax=Durusdinium trenchii TaxID=1381693 RepID=A0ABP0L463_9DINO
MEEPFPPLAPEGGELSEEAECEQAALLEVALDLSEAGDLSSSLEKLTAAICLGSATSLMYCRRADLLLRLQRPLATINDCSAALAVNAGSAKAYKIRARAHAQLENWTEAQSDFQKSLKIDFNEATEEEAKLVESKLAKASEEHLQRWEVVGGADKGGVVVRKGFELKSSEASCRLCTGAIVEELELRGERLRYRRLSGTGPDEGWISISLKDKVLACRLANKTADAENENFEEDEPPFPEMAPNDIKELEDDALEKQQMLKAQSAELADEQHFEEAMEKLTEAIIVGCATALMYGRRAELLMRLGRPRAAMRDCCRALELNPDSGKAYKTRARANSKLKRWTSAHADFQEGLKIDYDETTYEESLTVASKMKEITAVATARRVKEEADRERKQAPSLKEQELREQRARHQEEQQKAQVRKTRSCLLHRSKKYT